MSSDTNLKLSVIIPSHNGQKKLPALLTALGEQTLSLENFEVIIVLDGCTDHSDETIRFWKKENSKLNLHFCSQKRSGAAKARTHGAEKAKTPILLFLDDDVVPHAECLKSHLKHHETQNPLVVLGDAQIPARAGESYYDLVTRMWWEDTYVARKNRTSNYSYHDFCAGNVSLPRSTFFEHGGFDAQFQSYGGEDYDLGYRLLQAGTPFCVESRAQATHNHQGTPRKVFNNLSAEGRNDILLGKKHPELTRGLRCFKLGRSTRLLFFFSFLLNISIFTSSLILSALQQLHFWHAWRWLFGKTRYLAYWRGVISAFSGWRNFQTFCEKAPQLPTLDLDISNGLPEKLPDLWMHGPSQIKLIKDGQTLSEIYLKDPTTHPLRNYLANLIVEKTRNNNYLG